MLRYRERNRTTRQDTSPTTCFQWYNAPMHGFLRVVIAMVVGTLVGMIVAFMLSFMLSSARLVGIRLPIHKGYVIVPSWTAMALYARLEPDRVIESETRCRRCGIILRGLTEPRCPECGESI
jgi:ribosomal protein S27AE